MTARLFGVMTLALLVAAGAGCRMSRFSINVYDHHDRGHRDYVYHPPRVMHVSTHGGHVCGHGCDDHYWNGVELVVLDGRHRHGPSCGHHWSGSRWTLVAATGGQSRHHKGAKIKFKKH